MTRYGACIAFTGLFLLLNSVARAETLALICKNLNRNNTTPIAVDLAAATVNWGGVYPARITPASIDWNVASMQAVNHIDRSTGFFTETIQGKYVEQWQCRKSEGGGF
jgi:hypothetical protein